MEIKDLFVEACNQMEQVARNSFDTTWMINRKADKEFFLHGMDDSIIYESIRLCWLA
jgi:hypothetical protein